MNTETGLLNEFGRLIGGSRHRGDHWRIGAKIRALEILLDESRLELINLQQAQSLLDKRLSSVEDVRDEVESVLNDLKNDYEEMGEKYRGIA